MNMLPEAEKALLSQFNELGAKELRKKLMLGDFCSEGSPKYKFAQCYLKEEDRRAKQEALVELSVQLQHEANNLARVANRKSTYAIVVSIVALIFTVLSNNHQS